jgi:DNA-directed RNA polymerase subunit M/transcription elongation factor TFIIS
MTWNKRSNGWLDRVPRKKKREKELPPQPEDSDGAGTVWYPVLCPHCTSENVIVRSTQGDTRYYACRECGNRFKAVKGDPGTIA